VNGTKKIKNKKEKKMQEEKITACNNEKCIKKDKCARFKLWQDGAKEFTTNSGNEQKGCKKFIPRK